MCQEMESKCSNSKGEERVRFKRNKPLTDVCCLMYRRKTLPASYLVQSSKEMGIALGRSNALLG